MPTENKTKIHFFYKRYKKKNKTKQNKKRDQKLTVQHKSV